MKQILKTITIILLFSILNSCKKGNADSENIVLEKEMENKKKNEEILTLNSFNFYSSFCEDIFFIEDNKDKRMKVTDFLIEGYVYNKNDSSCYIYCTPYNKETNTLISDSPRKAEGNITLNGKPLKKKFLGKSYSIIVYLDNPKDLRKLEIFNPSEEAAFSTTRDGLIYEAEIKDIKSIKGTFTGIENTLLAFRNGEILD